MNFIDAIWILLALLAWHALADYPLQGDFLARGKAGAFEPEMSRHWLMAAHCGIHALGVAFITGSLIFAAIEFVSHWFIDRQKVSGHITFNHDQWLHVSWKAAYAVAWFLMATPA